MIETCSDFCSAEKYSFFLNTLTMLGTLLMAGAAIGAIDTWKKQRNATYAEQVLSDLIKAEIFFTALCGYKKITGGPPHGPTIQAMTEDMEALRDLPSNLELHSQKTFILFDRSELADTLRLIQTTISLIFSILHLLCKDPKNALATNKLNALLSSPENDDFFAQIKVAKYILQQLL